MNSAYRHKGNPQRQCQATCCINRKIQYLQISTSTSEECQETLPDDSVKPLDTHYVKPLDAHYVKPLDVAIYSLTSRASGIYACVNIHSASQGSRNGSPSRRRLS